MSTRADEVSARFSQICSELEMSLRQWVQLWTFTDKHGVQHHDIRLKVQRGSDALETRINAELAAIEKSGMKNLLRVQASRLDESKTVLQILSKRINNTGIDRRYTHNSGGHPESGYQHSISAGLPTLGKR